MKRILGSYLFSSVFGVVSMGALGSPSAVEGRPPRSKPFLLADLLASVDTHYPLIFGAFQDQKKAEGDVLSAHGAFDPLLKASYQATPSGEYENRALDIVIEQPTPLWGSRIYAGYRQGAGRFGPYDERLKTNSGGEVRGGIEVPLLRGGAIDDRRARIASIGRAVEASNQALVLQKLEARRQATLRYYDWIVSGEKLKVAQALLKLARDRDDAMQIRVRKGDAATIDRVDNERSVMQREAQVVASTRALEKSALELSLFLRDDRGRPMLASVDRLPSDALDESKSDSDAERVTLEKVAMPDAVDHHPEMKRMQALIDQVGIERDLAENMLLPKLDTELVVSQDFGVGTPAKERLEYKAGIKVELPLRLRTARGRLEGALASRLKLDAQKSLARDRLLMSLKDYAQAMSAAKTRVKMTQKELELSVQVENAERVRYLHGDSNLLMVNLREQATADARLRAIDALGDFHRAVTEATAISGGLAQRESDPKVGARTES